MYLVVGFEVSKSDFFDEHERVCRCGDVVRIHTPNADFRKLAKKRGKDPYVLWEDMLGDIILDVGFSKSRDPKLAVGLKIETSGSETVSVRSEKLSEFERTLKVIIEEMGLARRVGREIRTYVIMEEP
jgi:hypothetical protein